jgi:hypothetical protein
MTPHTAGNPCETDGEMSPEDAERWRTARTLADLGELTAQWLEGTIASIPTVMPGYGPDEETSELIPVLAACNRAGYITTVSQPGEEPAPGYDGRLWTQRAAVGGFAATLPWQPTRSTPRKPGSRSPWLATRRTRGSAARLPQETSKTIRPDTASATPTPSRHYARAWQVTIIDPEWGRNDVLWPVLESFAAE